MFFLLAMLRKKNTHYQQLDKFNKVNTESDVECLKILKHMQELFTQCFAFETGSSAACSAAVVVQLTTPAYSALAAVVVIFDSSWLPSDFVAAQTPGPVFSQLAQVLFS